MKIAGLPLAFLLAALLWLMSFGESATAQIFARKPMRKASEFIRRQEGPRINRDLEPIIHADNSRVVISLSRQRAYLLLGDQIYIDSPISSGKKSGSTPTGSFRILEKDLDHRSSIYGDFVERGSGRVVRSGISLKVDSAPSGTRYLGAPMRYFMRLTNSGVGMHIGILPGYPASHGCIRLPSSVAPLIYQKVKTGTQVVVES